MDPNPNIPNRPGLELEIIAWSGKVRPRGFKSYFCTSRRIQVDPSVYAPEVKAKLELGIGWELIETSTPPERDGAKKTWELVRRARFTMHFPESENVWWMIRKVICEDFSTPSRVQTQVRFIDFAAKSHGA